MKKRAFAIGARHLVGGFAAVLLAGLVFATQDDGPRFSEWSEPVNLGPPALARGCEQIVGDCGDAGHRVARDFVRFASGSRHR